MPTSIVEKLIEQIEHLKASLDAHLIESTGIKTDIVWLKWLMMLVMAGIMSLWLKG